MSSESSITLRGKTGFKHKLVLELRYRQGFSYLDRCGATINTILRDRPEWIVGSDPTSQSGSLISSLNGTHFTFSSSKCTLNLEQKIGGEALDSAEITDFVEQADYLSRVVVDQLGLKEFTRIGFRVWFMFPCKDKRDSEDWLLGLGCMNVNDSLPKAFGGSIEAVGTAIVIVGKDRKFRIAFNGVERHAQVDFGQSILTLQPRALSKEQDKILREQMRVKRRMLQNPEFAAIIDIDAFQEDPHSVDARDFTTTSLNQFTEKLRSAIPST